MVELPLTNSELKAQVSDEDWDLCFYKWSIRSSGYVCCTSHTFGQQLLHMIIADRMKMIRDEVDHENRVRHNCQRTNLRPATGSLNQANSEDKRTLRYRGVRIRPGGRFEAQIRKNGKSIYLGMFDSENQAALKYNEVAIQLFGEFANLNIIGEKSSMT